MRTYAMYCQFFLSGMAALIYEISWSRQVGSLLGHTIHAAAVVLTAWFAGLAVGYAWGARLAAKVTPLRAYAIAEFTTAAWACLVPWVLIASMESDFTAILHSRAPVGHLVRWLYCFLLLVPATAAMGTTLPLLAQWLSPGDPPAIDRVASAYAFNTAGAFVGTVLATVWLLASVGIAASGFIAAGLSAVCGLVALFIQAKEPLHAATRPACLSSRFERADSRDGSWLLLPAALSGCGILALEVLYARLFSLVLHNSTYTFGAVLAAVILALAISPFLVRVASRSIPPGNLLAWGAGAGAVTTVLSIYLFVLATKLEYLRFGSGFAIYLGGVFAVVLLVVGPPITLLGMILPSLWFRDANRRRAAESAGRTAFASALAGAAGAACTSLWLLPTVGLWASFAVAAWLFAVLAFAVWWSQGLRRRAGAAAALFCAISLPLIVPPGPERWATSSSDILVRRWDSAYGWIDVLQDKDGARRIRQNLHYRFGSTGMEKARAYRQAHLPLVLHPSPTELLFLGLGTGMTAGAAVSHEEVQRAVVVELIPEVVDAARLLAGGNFSVSDHPKFQIEIDDARHFLRRTSHRFDVIVSDLFVPWESQTGYLYTVEHYQAARQRLKPGGVFCQWLAVYQLGARELELISDSFAAVFPETSLWWGQINAHRPMIALIGSQTPLRMDVQNVNARLNKVYQTAPRDLQMRTAQDVLGLYIGHWRQRQPQRLNTDELPRIEFLTPLSAADSMLLQGESLRGYYDNVLGRLPDQYQRFGGTQPPTEARRTWQRLLLFPH